MAKRLLAACALFAGALSAAAAALAQDKPAVPAGPPANTESAAPPEAGAASAQTGQATPSQSGQGPLQPGAQPQPGQTPPARLIKHRSEPHTAERTHPHPLDERCRPLKDELEAALQKPGNAHRLFQARLAHNAGNRLCREGHPDRGMAEFQRGLSYLQENPHP
jgi:hypothetical protein